jgi:hypothetical protein
VIDRIREAVGRLGGTLERVTDRLIDVVTDRLIDVVTGGRPQVIPIPTER